MASKDMGKTAAHYRGLAAGAARMQAMGHTTASGGGGGGKPPRKGCKKALILILLVGTGVTLTVSALLVDVWYG
jgi:hypothetical protein